MKPIAYRYNTDLYLPTGEMSNTLVHQMAREGAEDGREMVVLYVADCDPSGYQMMVSVTHKLRALNEGFFPELKFRVAPACLTVEQVKSLGLPSTPLKPTEKRGDGWLKKHGVEQTEIDALATLRPDVLEQIVEEAIQPFYDHTLDQRVREAREEWRRDIQTAFDAAVKNSDNASIIEELRGEAEDHIETASDALDETKTAIDELRDAVEEVEFEVPDIDLPEPADNSGQSELEFVSGDMDLLDHIEWLRERVDYE